MSAPGRRTRRPAVLGRRGATLPLVVICMGAIVAICAFALDYGRNYLMAAELQTAADAAAIAAARDLQLKASTAYAAAPAAAIAMGPRNLVHRAAPTIASSDVRFVNYAASTGAITSVTWNNADAVEVTARAPANRIFTAALGLPAATMSRRATAWIANVQAATCITPFVLPYSGLMKLGGLANWNSPSAPDITQVQLNYVGGREIEWRTIVHPPPGTDANALNNTIYDNYGNWLAADFANGAASLDTYGDWVAQRNCATARAETRQPGVVASYHPAASIVSRTGSEIGAQCHFKTASSALCYPSSVSNTPGVVIRVVYGDFTSIAGGTPVTVRAVGMLRLMCYYRASTDVCPTLTAAQLPPLGWPHRFPQTGYPAGTVVGVVDAPVSIPLESTTKLGDTPTNVQRIVLVR